MTRKKKQEEGESHGAGMERWLLTYADMITLLMIFFIVMYAVSTINVQKLEAIAQSLSVVLRGKTMTILEYPGPSVIPGSSGQMRLEGPGRLPAQQGELEAVRRELEKMIQEKSVGNQGLAANIVIMEQERGLVISLKDTLLFPKGSADLTPKALSIIKEVAKSLKDIPNYIRVEGHTDDLPINTPKFPSNWELSVIRATNVAHVLIGSGVNPERISAAGYSEYRPLVPNINEKNRSMNRRVDIVILKQKYDYFEPPSENH